MMIRATNSTKERMELNSISNWRMTKAKSLKKKSTQSTEMLLKRRNSGSGKICKRQHKKGNSKLKKISREILTYST